MNERTKSPEMLTIKQAAERTDLAEHYIRRLCLENKIVYRRSGWKYLINYDLLVQFLNGSDF